VPRLTKADHPASTTIHQDPALKTQEEVAGCTGSLQLSGRATTDGFQTLEVWESKEHYDRANTDIVFPLMRELAGDQPPPSTEPAKDTFDVRGLVIPSGNILI